MDPRIITSIDLSERLYHKFAKLIYDLAGIALGDSKRELMRSRLLKRLRVLDLNSFEEYLQFLEQNDSEGNELVQLLDAISTNKTDFFREPQHFEFLTNSILPALVARAKGKGTTRIRFWSAGCSSGEEPYTLAMVLRDYFAQCPGFDVKILATDLSTRVLHTAYEGLYEEEKIAPIPPKFRLASFVKEKENGRAYYRVKSEVREMISFRRLNLMNPHFPFSGKFDVIFCRNVMIYFDKATQESLVGKYFDVTAPGGYLFIGHSESLTSLKTRYQFIKPTIYFHPL